MNNQWEIKSKKYSEITVSYEKRSVEIPWYQGPLKRDSVNSNHRRYIEDQIWGHPSKTGSAQPRGGRGRRNPDIYSYLLRNSTHTQRRGRSESLFDSPKGAFMKDVRPKSRFSDPPPPSVRGCPKAYNPPPPSDVRLFDFLWNENHQICIYMSQKIDDIGKCFKK